MTIDGRRAQRVTVPRNTGDAACAQAVLDNLVTAALPGSLAPGRHRIAITARSAAVALDRLILTSP